MLWLIYVIIAIILMSLNTFLVKKLVKNINPYVILFYQYLIAIPLVAIYSLLFNADIFAGNMLIVLLGVVYVAAIALVYIALKTGSLSKVSPVFNLKMLVPAILGVIILSEALSLQLVLGLLFGIIGVVLLSGDEK